MSTMIIHFKDNRAITCRVGREVAGIAEAASNSKDCRLILEFLDEGNEPRIGRVVIGEVDHVELSP